jgi:hypothetical protein
MSTRALLRRLKEHHRHWIKHGMIQQQLPQSQNERITRSSMREHARVAAYKERSQRVTMVEQEAVQ